MHSIVQIWYDDDDNGGGECEGGIMMMKAPQWNEIFERSSLDNILCADIWRVNTNFHHPADWWHESIEIDQNYDIDKIGACAQLDCI